MYSKTSHKDGKFVFKTNYPLMLDKSIAECSKGSKLQHSAIFLTFVKLFVRDLCKCLFLSDRFTQVLL